MRTIISIAIIIVASVIGFFMGAGMSQPMGGQLYSQRLRDLHVQFKLLRARKNHNLQLIKSIFIVCRRLAYRLEAALRAVFSFLP